MATSKMVALLFMEHDFFKHTISNGLQFYFKPLLDSTENVYYEVKGYRNNVKAFKIVQKEKDKDGHSWEFAHEAQVPDAIKKMESEFLDAIVLSDSCSRNDTE